MAQQRPLRLGIRTTPAQINLTDLDALHRTTFHGQIDNVWELLNGGADVNLIDPNGWTALQVASAYGHLNIAKVLLTHGADTDIKLEGSTALHMASKNGYPDIVTLLLEHKAEPDVKRSGGITPLHLAAGTGQRDVIRALAKGGADLEEPSDDRAYNALHIACDSGYSECTEELLLAGANPNARSALDTTPLMVAAVSDHPNVAIALLKSGADVDAEAANGRTASMIAAHFGSSHILRVLISEGANLDAVDISGCNALYFAIIQNKPSTALLLLEHRIRVNTHYGDHQDTALHLAVSMNQPQIVRTLLAKGADLEACDADGDAPLQWAVQGNRMEMVKILLCSGAQINKRNNRTGETVLKWAVTSGLLSMTQALLLHGSDPSTIDLDNLQKDERHDERREVDDEDFETCKILVETATLTKMDTRLPEQFKWPLTEDAEDQVGGNEQETPKVVRNVASPDSITNPIYNLPDQVSAESLIAQFQEKVMHDCIKCNGPHCAQRSESLYGIRYKCTWCDDVNLCSTCISSFFNNHEHYHPMIRCLLPTQIHKIVEVDEDTKQLCMRSDPQSGIKPQDITHIMYAITDKLALRQLQINLSTELSLAWSQAASLQKELAPTLFAICKQQPSKELQPRKPRIIERNEPKANSLSMYKIGDFGNINLQHFTVGEKSLTQDHDEQILHYQDANLLCKVLTGVMKRFKYNQDKTFHKWAWEGRAVTRVVELRPGKFDDKIEIELRTIDLKQDSSYEALSYTWKETAYERALTQISTPEMDLTMKSIIKLSHGVYCHNADGSEAFLAVNTGLRDALKRLRDPHETKTFWIDQLAVNQQDVGERAFQVQAMRQVYNRARRVTVWTGDEDPYTPIVFETYKRIAHVHQELSPFPSPNDFMQLTEATSIEAPILQAMYEFFRRPVFSRCWCIQEIVVGQRVVVRCGDFEIDWTDLRCVAMVLMSTPWVNDLHAKMDSPAKKTDSVPFQAESNGEATSLDSIGHLGEVIMIGGLRDDFHANKELSLEAILYITGQFQASEPRDKIYAVLGIRAANIHPGRHKDDLQADYKQSDAEAFTAATKFCIQQSDTLHICGMMDTVSRKKTVGLPSWVPDYSCNSISSLFAYCRPQPQIPYNASGQIPSMAVWPYEHQSHILVTSSCCVETIETVSEHCTSTMKQKECSAVLTEWSSLVDIEPLYPTGELVPDIFLMTCCVDSAGSSRLRSSPQPQRFLDMVSILVATAFMQYLAEKFPDGAPVDPDAHLGRTAQLILKDAIDKFSPTIWGFDEHSEVDEISSVDGLPRSVTGSSSSQPVCGKSNDYGDSDSALAEREAFTDETDTATGNANQTLRRPGERDEGEKNEIVDAQDLCLALKSKNKGKEKEIDDSYDAQRHKEIWTQPTTLLSTPDPELRAMAVQSITMACLNRKFFVTGNKYFGLGPADMQKGDEIHILSGTKVPFVMRKVSNMATTDRSESVDQDMINTVAGDGMDLYLMIGECFVHGFMQGEVESRVDLTWEGIAIC